MKKVDVRYWISLGLVSAVLAAAAWIVFGFYLPQLYPRVLPWFLGVMIVITGTGQVLLTQALKRDPKKFNSWFMIYKSVKILILMTFLVAYLLINRENALSLLISVFVIYLVFLLFEAASLNKVSRREAGR